MHPREYDSVDRRLVEAQQERDRLKRELEESRSASEANPMILQEQRRLEELRAAVEASARKKSQIAQEYTALQSNLGQFQYSEDAMRARYDEAKDTLGNLQKGLELCLILDSTYSMESWLAAAKQNIIAIFEGAQKLAGDGAPVRIAFIAYRDFEDGVRHNDGFPFRERKDQEELKETIKNVKIGNGVDYPEDIAGALEICRSFEWKYNNRLIFHITDAPCHGRKFHDYRDNFPDGDPNYDIEEIVASLAKNRINYHFLALDPSCTDKMTDIFADVYRRTASSVRFSVIRDIPKDQQGNPDAAALLPTVIESIRTSCRRN